MGNRKFYSNFMNVMDNRISKKKEECDVLEKIMCSQQHSHIYILNFYKINLSVYLFEKRIFFPKQDI